MPLPVYNPKIDELADLRRKTTCCDWILEKVTVVVVSGVTMKGMGSRKISAPQGAPS